MKKKYEKSGLIANIILAVLLLASLAGDYCFTEKINVLQYEESKDRELFITNYTDVILDYLVYDAGQARLALSNVMGETDVLIYSLFPMEIKAVNNKNPNQTAEFSKTALLDKAQKLQGYDFVDNNNEILNLKRQSTILFYVQILLIFCVIIINSLSFTVFKK